MVMRCVGLAVLLWALTGSEASAQEEPIEREQGVRGRVVVAPELPTTPWPLSEEREAALKTAALVRRSVRLASRISEPPGPLVVMLEGDGIKQDRLDVPKLVLEGMRFTPGGIVVPRVVPVPVENKMQTPVTLIDGNGSVLAQVGPGQTVEVALNAGTTIMRVKEMPFATTSVRVLERGRVLPVESGDIPLTDIPGGLYMLSFFLGSEPLRVQELTVPDESLVFIDATVSQKGVVDISIKDASQREAVRPSGVPKEPAPAPPPDDAP